MRKMMLVALVMLLMLLPACRRADRGKDFDIQGEAPVDETVIYEEYPAPGPEEPEPEEPEIAFEDSVASITPDFREDIRTKKLLNPDTIGWLYIPDTNIDQVILQNPPEMGTNQFYLDVDFNRMPDKNGTFCTDFRNLFDKGTRESLSRITTIYGHSWCDDPDGILFEQIKRFKNPDYARTHPYIFFSTQAENMAWEVVAVFDTIVDLPYITPDLNDSEMYDLLNAVDKLSEYSYASAVAPDDKLLVLSTCTYSVRGHERLPERNNYRFAVMAKLVGPNSQKLVETVFHINENPAPPDMVKTFMRSWRKDMFPVYINQRAA